MKILKPTKMGLTKLAVLAAGLAAAAWVATMSPQAAHAYPRAASCTGCHAGATTATTTATPSTANPAAGAPYTVAITLTANPAGGNSGYGIVPATVGTGSTFGGNTGPLLSYTATMTAPAAAGSYSYTVWTNQGPTSAGQVGSAVYSITVTGGTATTPPATTPPATTPPATTPPATTPPATTPPVTTSIHGPYAINSAQCGTCHRTHTAQAPNLLRSGSPISRGSQSTLCLGCHNGTGAGPAVMIQYQLERPVNNADAREYYSHDAVDASPATAHTQSGLNEFGGVFNRHSECADCHNSHQATATAARDSAQTADGWDASRRLAGVSGVSVVNGPAGTAPAYALLSGSTDSTTPNPVTLEYQLCFKCHSGFTQLLPKIPGKPSKDLLDKGVEFNPNNSSFHPVEAAGKNDTLAMRASLAGASTYKLWDFQTTNTIRCLNCHASSETPGTAPLPQPGSALAPHTSKNRGILIRNYQDRVLKPMSGTDAAYSAGDFALCYVCHGQAPFAPGASSDPGALLQTNFPLHSQHVTELAGKGAGGTDIDTAGNGGGNAICAECHFRLHSTTDAVGTQTLTGDPVSGSHLVNFAPNVKPFGTTLSWTSAGTGGGSCTLTCHGHNHGESSYSP